jgi:hypothetical protein
MGTLAKETVTVGQYCNTTLKGKPVSVRGGNCPGCESLFVCDDAYDGSAPQPYTESVLLKLAMAYCNCTDPSQSLLNLFGPVQYVVQGGSLCMEFTIYSGNPNATAADIVVTLKTKRTKGFDVCTDDVDGCIGDSGDDSLLWIIIGVAAFCLVLALGIGWYFVHKRVDKQYRIPNEVATVANEIVVDKMMADMADVTKGDSKSIKNEITPAPTEQERLSEVQSWNNNINVPIAAASTGPRCAVFTKPIDTAATEDDYNY